MPHRQTDTISISAKDFIASGLRYGFSREALLQALEEVAPEVAKKGEVDWASFLEAINAGLPFKLKVDYSKTVFEMIAAGKYGYVNDFLQNNEPVLRVVSKGKALKSSLWSWSTLTKWFPPRKPHVKSRNAVLFTP